MSSCAENAKPVADVLKNVNALFGGKVWSEREISSVSNKIACNFVGDLGEIFNIALVKPFNRRPDLVMTYKNNGGAENDNTYKLEGLSEVNAINFGTTPAISPNKEQGIIGTHFREGLHLLNLDTEKNTAENALRAYAVYYDDSANSVSSSDYANYLVTGANGIFEGAQRVRIDFYKDRTRKVTVMFN